MGIIAKIGPLELSLILFFAVLLLYRIQAKPESRAATALVFIFSAQFGSLFVNGFPISGATKLSFGELNTVFAYLMLACAFLEVLLLKGVTKWKSLDLFILLGLLGLGILNLAWKLAFNTGFRPNDLLYVLPVLLVLSLRPKKADLRFLAHFGTAMIILVLITALAKYQNPLFPYYQTDYGLGGQYQNRLWGFLGWEERFRGPYSHPNQLGIQITFLSLLVLLKPTKLYLAILPISFTLLFLASSRTSIFALTLALLLRIYFEFATDSKLRASHTELDFSKGVSSRRLTLKKIFLGLSITFGAAVIGLQILGSTTSGASRLDNNRLLISSIRENLLLGSGPSLFSINSTENTILTLLSYYGLFGLIFLLSTTFAFTLKLKKLSHSERGSFFITFFTYLVASTGEATLSGDSKDSGLYYLIVLLLVTREAPLRKDLL